MHEKEKAPVTACPHCGSDSGFYRETYFSGKGSFNYNWDGTSGDNTELHESVQYRELKTSYCQDCRKPVKLPV